MIELITFMFVFGIALLLTIMCYPHIGFIIHEAIANWWHKYIMRK
jgi:hypothetical protein